MKITGFDDDYTQRLGLGETTLVSGTSGGSNSALGGDVSGSLGNVSVDGLRRTVSLASNLGSGVSIGDVLTIQSVAGTPVAHFAAPSNTGGTSGTDLGWFDITDYGALCDGVTDDTVAVKAAVDAATAAGGGVIYHPGGICIIGGALQDTGAFNGQVLLPNVSHSGDHIVLTFKGALRPGFHPVYTDTVPLAAGLSVYKSTLTGASGTASAFSGGNDLGAPSSGHGNNLEVYVDDLVCLGPDNPTFTFWNLSACQGGGVGALQISTPGAFAGSPTQPTNTNAYGIKLPQVYFASHIDVGTLSVGGFYTGVLDGELTVYGSLLLGPLIYGIEVPATFYPTLVMQLVAGVTQRVIRGTGDHRIDVLQYAVEHYSGGGWQATVYDVDDASNHLYGFVRWYNAATGGTADHSFTVNGASNLGNQEMGSTWGGSALTIKDEGVSLATAATSIDFVGSGVTASGTGAAKTVTITTSVTAAAIDALGFVGPIIIADSPSTPLVFADLLQNDAQDDLMYADL